MPGTWKSSLIILAAFVALHPAPAQAESGGPDRAGYEWIDSNEPSEELTYEWIDISDVGTAVEVTDDGESELIPIGFDFTFYGLARDSVRVGGNGYLSFQSNDYTGAPDQCPLPDPDAPNNAIYGFYQDLNPEEPTSGTISYATLLDEEESPTHFVVTFDGIDLFQGEEEPFGSDPVTFQIVLYPDTDEIRVNVQDSGELAGGPRWSNDTTIGIENEDGSLGLGLCPGEGGITDEYSVHFRGSQGFALFPSSQRQAGTPGETTEFELELFNFSTEEVSAAVEIESEEDWTIRVDDSIDVAPDGEVTTVDFEIDVPEDAEPGSADVLTITITIGETELSSEASVVVTFPSSEWQFIQDLPEGLQDVELVSDGTYLYALGGGKFTEHADGRRLMTPFDVSWRWSPENNWWTDDVIADMPIGLTGGSACYLEGRIFYVGGYDGTVDVGENTYFTFSPDIYIYDIRDDEWTTGNPPPHAIAHANVVCNDASDLVYVINGYADLDADGILIDRSDGGEDWTEPHTLVYDAEGDSWYERTASDEGVSGAGVGLLGTEIIMAGGAFDDAEDPDQGWVTRATRHYDIVSDSWSNGPWLAQWRSRLTGVVFGDHMCGVGGISSGSPMDNWECYSSSVWIEQVDMISFPRSNVGAVVLDGHIYVVGGDAGETVADRSERWPTADLVTPTEPEADGDADGDVDGDGDADADTDADADADTDTDDDEDGTDEGDDDGCGCRAAGQRGERAGSIITTLIGL